LLSFRHYSNEGEGFDMMHSDDISMDFIEQLTQKLGGLSQKAALKTGRTVADGSIYLGRYNNKDWFVAAEDAKNGHGEHLTLSFNQAAHAAEHYGAHGHRDWMVPPGHDDPSEPDILTEMFNNKNVGAFKGTYDESDSLTASWYWSSTLFRQHPDMSAWQRNFSVEDQINFTHKDNVASVRCVRSVPVP
jgi:hypothetical protein